MEFKNFDEILQAAGAYCLRNRAVIANAADPHVMAFLALAEKEGIARPVLTGNAAEIRQYLDASGLASGSYEIVDCTKEEAAQTAVSLVQMGKADFLMKGMLETSDFLHPIVKKENALRLAGVMSYQAFLSVPGYHKLLLCTDGGMVPYPDQEKKKQIMANAIETLHLLGYETPKAAVLCCKETVDPKMPETIDADALHQAAMAGAFGNAVVDGPLSYDICMSAEIAATKHFFCPHAGDYDIMLFPNIHCANILVKSLIIHSKAVSGGIIAGCKVPVVAPSRGCKPEEQLLSAALATLVAAKGGAL